MSNNLYTDNNNHMHQNQSIGFDKYKSSTTFNEKVYFIENLDCANCGAKLKQN